MSRDVVGPLTPDEEVATDDKHDPDRSQHEPSAVSVVFVAHEADPTHRVSIHLQSTTQDSPDKIRKVFSYRQKYIFSQG